jgi:hypothetical protein
VPPRLCSDLSKWSACGPALLATLALGVPSTAAAAPPSRTTSTVVVDEPSPNFACPNGSAVLSTFTIERTSTLFLDRAGEPVRETRHGTYEGRLYSADLRRSVPYGGNVNRVLDFEAGTITVRGHSTWADLPSGRVTTAGRRVLDIEADEFVRQSGHTTGDFERAVCAALYPEG